VSDRNAPRTSVRIGRLRLSLDGGAGHEHRVRPMITQALQMLQRHLHTQTVRDQLPPTTYLRALSVPTLRLDLRALSNESVAQRVADSLAAALHHGTRVQARDGGNR
jgi:hypothetical protein